MIMGAAEINLEKLTSIINERRLLHSKLLSLDIESHENSSRDDDISTEERDELLSKISYAKSELLQIKTDKFIQETLLQSLQLNYVIANSVFKANNEEEEDSDGIAKHRSYFLGLITGQNKLTLKFTKSCQRLEDLQNRFDELQNRSQELKSKKQALLKEMATVSQQAEGKENKNNHRLEICIKEKMKLIGVLQQVFQKIIQSSQIQWSDSTKLQALLLDTKSPFS